MAEVMDPMSFGTEEAEGRPVSSLTSAEIAAYLSRITELLRGREENLKSAPLNSPERTALLDEQRSLIKRYMKIQAFMQAKFGTRTDIVNGQVKVDKTVDPNLLQTIATLENPDSDYRVTDNLYKSVGSQIALKGGTQQGNQPKDFAITVAPVQGQKPATTAARRSNKANATKPLPQGIAGPVLATGTSGAIAGTGRATGGAAGTGRGGKGGKGNKVAAPPANWEAKFREFFPSQSWLIDIDPVQYPGLRKLLQEAVVGQMWSSPEGQARFASQLDGTDFYTFLRDNQVVRTINTSVGDLGFDSTNFNKFVTSAANFGWTGDRLKQETYREAFRKNDDGTYANATARQRVIASNDYKRIEGIARAYFNPISEDMVAKTLTGEMSTDDVDRQQRELAKTKYSHLSGLLDQGFTMSDLAQPYQKIAGNLLEKDPNTVDMTNTDFEAAYNYTDESGNKRLLTSGEWQRMIKSDAKYGWQNTDNAKQSAQRLALSIAQSFGRLM